MKFRSLGALRAAALASLACFTLVHCGDDGDGGVVGGSDGGPDAVAPHDAAPGSDVTTAQPDAAQSDAGGGGSSDSGAHQDATAPGDAGTDATPPADAGH